MAGVADQFEQHVTKMNALGRKFYLGDKYDYRTDQVIKGDGCWESSEMTSATKVENNFKFRCIISMSDSNKRDHIGLDDHSKVSTIAGLIERCRGATTYLNDRKKPGEISQTVVFRIKSRKEYLELATLINVPKTDRKETTNKKCKEGTHVVVGVVYGAEAYCVLTKDLISQTDEDAREEAKVDLDNWAEKMQSAIEANQDLIQFKEQFDKEERTKLTRMKCRLYLDIQTPTFRECNYFDAYQHCAKLIEKIRKTDGKFKTVPISLKLCPLNAIKNINGNEYQEIESTLTERCCRALDKLEFICDKAEVVRKLTSEKFQRDTLRDFKIQVDKCIGYVRNSLKECIVRFRSDGDENAVEKVIQRIENHFIFKPSRLKRWLSYKSSELEMTTEIANLTEISFLPNAIQLKKELGESLNKKYSLVFQIPALDQETNQVLETMKNYFDTYIKLVEVDEDGNNDVENNLPWHMIKRKRNQVMDKIKEFSDYIAKNTSSIENQVQFLLAQVENGQKLDLQYLLYEKDCFLKGFNQLPDCPPTDLRVYLLPSKNQSSYFRLEWEYEDLGYPIQYFIIEHRPKDCTDEWIQQITTKSKHHDINIKCKSDVVTEFRVAVSTCVGQSKFSKLINTQLALDSLQTDEVSQSIETNNFKSTQLFQVPDTKKLLAAISNAELEQNVKISDLNSVLEYNEKKEGKDIFTNEDKTRGYQIKDCKLLNKITKNSIQLKSKTLSQNSVLKKIPQMGKILSDFQELIDPLWKKIERLHDSPTLPKSPDVLHPQFTYISGLFAEIEAWLNKIGQQIALLSWLLHEVNLKILNWSEFESRAPSSQEKSAKVFVLKINRVEDQLIEKIKKQIGRTEELNISTFPELTISKYDMNLIKSKLVEFALEADSRYLVSPNPGIGYYIGLVAANNPEMVTGDIKTIEYHATIIQEERNTFLTVPSMPVLIQQQLEIGDRLKNSEAFQDPAKNTEVDNFLDDQEMSSISSRSSSTDDLSGIQEPKTVARTEGKGMFEFVNKMNKDIEQTNVGQEKTVQHKTKQSSRHSVEIDAANTISEGDKLKKKVDALTIRGNSFDISYKTISSQSSFLVQNKDEVRGNPMKNSAITKEKVNSFGELKNGNQQRKTKTFDNYRRYQQIKRDKSLANRRIAEVFAEDNNVSELLKRGKPNVYLLKAEENSMSTKLRCFNVVSSEVKSSLRHRNHKVVILVGATGCGKSTLINGMVNYILGVQWNDPFRFKVVREDESATSRNQAHSQTSSVTAYTLEHQDGMTVPYSITIIDTPGYGDTRGVQRDKDITRAIHRFLSQTDTEINEIHAVCFVAASENSRLTVTQKYILDSVLSTFGNDVKDNIRLLVTFADNADPPVVEACKTAYFPTTSKSAEIIYSKFNSSVLYACNELKDDFSFDELFWDMGQENFQKFFKMLEAMKGCDLTSTREVIGRRQQAEWALKNIEKEIDICLVEIENREKFQKQIIIHENDMEANRNHTFEVTELRPRLVSYKSISQVAYNCHKCKKTCEFKVFKLLDKLADNNLSILLKLKCNSCSCSISDHEYQRSVYRQEEVKVTRTLHDMKTQFETSNNKKLSTQDLLNKCSEDLELAKVKVLSLLSQLEANARSLDSTALLSTALSAADYLSLMRSRVAEEQKPGYMTRLETLTELEKCLAAQATTRTTAVTRSSRNSSGFGQNFSQRTQSYHGK